MDLAPDVVWLAHPSFRCLSFNEELTIRNYFECTEQSGGGHVVDWQRVSDKQGDTCALLVKFTDPQCVDRVCQREHNLGVIFASMSNKLVSNNQKIEARRHTNLDAGARSSCADSSDGSFIVRSECGDSPMDAFVIRSECGDSSPQSPYQASEVTRIVVSDFPSDCVEDEIIEHFSSFTTGNLTASDVAWNADSKVFIITLPSHVAEKILQQPHQLLDDEDEDSGIKIQRFVEPSKKLLVRGEKTLNTRLLKNGFRKLVNANVQVEKAADDGMQYIVTLSSAQEAENLAQQECLALTPTLQVHVDLYYGPAGSCLPCLSSSTLTSPERSDSPMSVTSIDTPAAAYSMRGEPKTQTSRVQPVPQGIHSANDASPCLSKPSHVEIEKLADLSVKEMYDLLCIHLFPEDNTHPKLEHSYDEAKQVFRFDLRVEDIEEIIGSKQVLLDEKENSTLSIRPLYTGTVIILRVSENPGKVKLDKSNLTRCFGKQSHFASTLTFLAVTRNRADVKMESCSVASKVVSIGQHTLDNKIVLKASFPSADDTPASDKTDEQSAKFVVLLESTASKAVLSKFMKSRTKGSLTQGLGNGRYLVEYETIEAAQSVVDQQVLTYMETKIHVRHYNLEEEEEDEEEEEEEEENEDESQPSHVEIKRLTKMSPEDMHGKLLLHLKKATGNDVSASFQQSWDEPKQIFRFDMCPADISTLTNSAQFLNARGKKSKLSITSASTGHNVKVSSCRGSKKNLSKTQIKAAFGPKSIYSCKVDVISSDDREMELAFASCSVAALIVSKRKHELKNGMTVEASFPGVSAASSSSSNEDSEEEEIAEDEGILTREVPLPNQSKRTLVIRNLLDVDEEIIYFWVKSLLNVWPKSIQLSSDGESAIVKFSGCVDIDINSINSRCSAPEFQVHGERASVYDVQATTALQVISSTSQANASIDKDTLESYFSNPRFTGVKDFSSLKSVRSMGTHNGLPVHIITYSTSQDVENVLQRKPLQFGNWKFDIAEFYPDVGVCGQDSLFLYRNNYNERQGPASSRSAVIHINNIDEQRVDFETLMLYMSNRKRTNGGDISSWRPKSGGTSGYSSVQIVYTEPGTAERVFDLYSNRGLTFNNMDLELELDVPWLTELHDDHKLRLLGLGNGVDPEKIKFYLSAVSDNVVIQLFFDQLQTKAVATFQNVIDYGRILDKIAVVSLKDCPQLRVQQDYKTKDLIAKGSKLTKDNLELPLESILRAKFNNDVEVRAEELPGTTDLWRITTEPQALEYILKESKRLSRCESLAPFSEFLGLHVTSGGQKKTEDLSSLLSDELMLQFLQRVPSAWQRLSDYLSSIGMTLSKDGVISLSSFSNKKNDRVVLKHWRSLKSILDQFITKTFSIFKTKQLTLQMFERLSRELPKLLERQPVYSNIDESNLLTSMAGYHITIVGEVQLINQMNSQVLKMIERFELEIKEEKSVQQVTVPNILAYQIKYLERINYFNQMLQKHKLNSFSGDASRQNVTMKGRPTSIDSAQKEMFDLLPKVADSKVSVVKTPLFLRVFNTDSAQEAIKDKLDKKKLLAVWVVENRTISIYSDNSHFSKGVLDCMMDIVWEAQYPTDRDLDELEKKLLASAVWQRKKKEVMDLHKPLQVVELGDRPGLTIVGILDSKNIVLEEIPLFFDLNVIRALSFDGIPDRIVFFKKFKFGVFKELEQEHSVTISLAPEGGIVKICGTKDNIANCQRSLKKRHDSICRYVHTINDPSLMQYIREERDFLDTLGFKHNCLVVDHKEDAVVRPEIAPRVTKKSDSAECRYSVTLPGGTVCEVCKDDLPSMHCDAIVNAANGDLAHVGGLALAVVTKGGSSIQKECREFILRNGSLMEGQAFTSSAGSLKCKNVIHAVGPRWRNGYSQEEFLLFQCIDSCMDEAEKHRLQSIAIPPVSTGIFGFPLNKAVKNIIDVVETRVKQGGYLPRRIVFVDNKDNSLDIFEKELSSRFQARQAKSPLPKSGLNVKKVATKSDKFTVTGNNINILNRINVEIRKGDMSNSQEEALVNSVGNNFNLSAGKVSKAISAMAGPQLQATCSAHGPLRSGDVVETDGFQLPCQKVFHCNCPNYQGTFALQGLKRIVGKCLAMASSHNYQSIAFPALGTGNLRYPEAEVAKAMIEAVLEYADGNPNSSLKDVKIVIYHLDHNTQRAFDGELERLSGAGAASATGPQHSTNVKRDLSMVEQDSILLGGFDTLDELPWQKRGSHKSVGGGSGTIKGSVKVNDATVSVIEGDITAHVADVLVNSTDSSLSIQGRVTQALLAKAGPAVRQEIQQLRSQLVQDGIWVSSGGNLSAQNIFHVDAQSCRGSNDKWKKLLSGCLEKCDGSGMTSIAFPALGTGAMGADPKEMAKVILQAILKYLSDNPHSLLQRIDVVIYQSEMVDSFVRSMKKCIEKPEPWWTRLAVKVSDWLQGVSSSDYPAQQDPYQQPKGRRVSHHMDAQSSVKSELKLDIYGNTNADIESCKEDINVRLRNALSTIMWRDKPTYMEDRDNISKLSELQLERLQTEARKLNVKLEVDKRLCNIKIVGLNRQIITMSDFIVKELKRIEKKIHDKKEEVLIARAIQWKYEDASAEWVNFDNVTNKALEETYIKNPQAVFKYETSNGEVILDLRKMEGTLHLEKFKIARKDLSKPQGLEMPSHWAAPLDTYTEQTLVPGTAEYQEVEKNFMATLGARGSAVLEIKRVQNPTLYQHYIILRKDVAKRLGKTEGQVEHSPLWHGTAEDTVSFITSGKFDRGLSGKNATALGCGSYFAKNTSYSAQDTYSKPNAQGHKYIIQTRVITGEYCQGSNQMRAAPYKPNKPTEQYDSVVDNPNNPTIFVVFHDASAYPDYIIKFQ